jgi:uncharacterized membrane protein (UPF0136 family)
MVDSYSVIVLFHVLAVIVAVGAVTVIDYLHLIGLRKKKLEKQLKNIYPNLSRLINISLAVIYLTGIFLVIKNPALLGSSLFLTKMALVVLVTVNGIYLQKSVSPHLDLCVLKGTKYCSSKVLYSSAISGGISIVTWYSIVILAFTKNFGYTTKSFLMTYFIILILVVLVALHFERKARKWRD